MPKIGRRHMADNRHTPKGPASVPQAGAELQLCAPIGAIGKSQAQGSAPSRDFYNLPIKPRVCRITGNTSPGWAFSANIIPVDRPALLGLQAPAAVRTPSLASVLAHLAPVSKRREVPALDRTVHLRLLSDRISHGLVQQLPASIALFGDVKPQAIDVGKFRWREDHVPPPFVLTS